MSTDTRVKEVVRAIEGRASVASGKGDFLLELVQKLSDKRKVAAEAVK